MAGKVPVLKMKKKRISILFFVLIISGLTSCREIGLYEKHTVIPEGKWNSNFSASGKFMIKDTVNPYSLSIILRHTDTYNFNNIWLRVGLKPPGDTMHFQKVELSLGNDASGWEGAGMNDIWEVRKPLNAKPQRFIKPGLYEYKIFQVMREDPLPHVMSAGLRVEKVQ